MNRGFIFSYDALLFLAAVSFLVLQMAYLPAEGKEHFLILQKQHDLVKVWLMEGSFEKGSIARDLNFVFPNKSGSVYFGNEKIIFGSQKSKGKRASVVECIYIKGPEIRKLTFSVFY